MFLIAALIMATTATRASADSKAECMDRWQKATDGGIVYQVGMVGGTPTVVVDEPTFLIMAFETKQGMVDTLNCALFEDGSKLAEIVFISNLTHKRLARWTPFRGLVVD